jgi:formate dehydrogenase subunit gamma
MEQKFYQRFNLFERWQHIILFSSITVLVLTGFPLRYYDIPFWRWVYSLFGGLEVARVLHRIFAVIFLADFTVHVVYVSRKVIQARKQKASITNSAFTILPLGKDFVDLFQNILYLLHLRKQPPKFGRFSYKEKFDYWAVWWGTLIMLFTGFVMFFPTVATSFLPGQIVPLSMIAHSYEALLDVLVIIGWHFYAVHLRLRYFPMSSIWLDGKISAAELQEDHPLEFESLMKDQTQGGKANDE